MSSDTCCGCIELKTGCYIIGILDLISNLVFTVLLTLGFIAGITITHVPRENETEQTVASMIVFGLIIVFMLLSLIFDIVMLAGLSGDKPGNLKAYLIFSSIFLVISFVHDIFTFNKAAFLQWLLIILFRLLNIYFLVVIRSMYCRMNEASRGGVIYQGTTQPLTPQGQTFKQNNFGQANNHNNFGQINNPNNCGYTDNHNFGYSNTHNNFGQPNNHDNFGQPNNHDNFGQLNNHDNFGQPNNHGNFEQVNNQNNFGQANNPNFHKNGLDKNLNNYGQAIYPKI